MTQLKIITPPPLPVLKCPQHGCHGTVVVEEPEDGAAHFACPVCFAEWSLDGASHIIRIDCVDCGWVNVGGAHTC